MHQYRPIPARTCDRVQKFICRFLNTRPDLAGHLSLTHGRRILRIRLGTQKTRADQDPPPMTDAHHVELDRLGREICERFGFGKRNDAPHLNDTRMRVIEFVAQ